MRDLGAGTTREVSGTTYFAYPTPLSSAVALSADATTVVFADSIDGQLYAVSSENNAGAHPLTALRAQPPTQTWPVNDPAGAPFGFSATFDDGTEHAVPYAAMQLAVNEVNPPTPAITEGPDGLLHLHAEIAYPAAVQAGLIDATTITAWAQITFVTPITITAQDQQMGLLHE